MNSYGILILALFLIILLIMITVSYITAHPEYGVTIPPLFGSG